MTFVPLSSRNDSAADVTYGPTVLEPSALTVPPDAESPSSPPHPAATTSAAGDHADDEKLAQDHSLSSVTSAEASVPGTDSLVGGGVVTFW